jgi:capsular polysaccharide transport system permease protein
MKNTSLQDLENRFNQLKSTLSVKQWADADLLRKMVTELEQNDPALAYRLMQRVKNLRPSPQSLARLESLKERLNQAQPEVLRSQSAQAEPISSKAKIQNIIEAVTKSVSNPKFSRFTSPFFLCVALPFLLFAFYQIVWASDRYESRAQLILKEPDSASTLDPALAVLSGLGGASSGNDTHLLKTYIHSMDMLGYLQQTLDIRTHFTSSETDMFSRLDDDASNESLLAYFIERVGVDIDELSTVIQINAQGFTPQFAQDIALKIVVRAEWFINKIGNDLAQAQLEFVKKEHAVVEKRLLLAKNNILEFQRKYNLLDPEAEGLAFQQIAYTLEAEIASKKAQLRTLLSGMSESAPAVVQLNEQLKSIQRQLEIERERLTNNSPGSDNVGVGELLAKYSNYKIDVEFALQAYASSQISLEKSRIEAYRQIKYLVSVESPILPEDAKYPEKLYNLMLILVVLLLLFGIGRIIAATVNELR